MNKISVTVLKREIFFFIVITLIGLILFTFYNLIKPERDLRYNFQPFPNVSPKDLPDAPTEGQPSCYNTLTKCDQQDNCSKCGEENFECVQVEEDGQYNFNGIYVPKGKWCLPKKDGTNDCNIYTGRWTWSSGECENGKSQCWKCLCLYPDLYTNSKQGCSEQLVCINPNIAPEQQKNNKLVGTKYSPYKDKSWDPFGDPDTTVAKINPYTSDENGNPWFACTCDNSVGDNKLPFVNLPGDPFICHIDSCWEYNNNAKNGLECDANTKNCSCDCKDDGYKFKEGIYKGKCIALESLSSNDICKDGTLDIDSDICNCPLTISTDCNSNYVSRPGSKNCENPLNPVGKECWNSCDGNLCKNNSNCLIDKNQDKKYSCQCVPYGKDCDGNALGITSGEYCEKHCYTSGAVWKREYVDGGIICEKFDKSECCNDWDMKLSNNIRTWYCK
jgi:hypothetical protein